MSETALKLRYSKLTVNRADVYDKILIFFTFSINRLKLNNFHCLLLILCKTNMKFFTRKIDNFLSCLIFQEKVQAKI